MSELRARIRALVAQALASGSLDAEDRRAAEVGLLPLFDDFAYRYYLADDGGVLLLDGLVPEDGLQPMEDERWRLAVHRAVVERWPALAALIPARPLGLADCAECRGTGRRAVRTTAGARSTTICSACRGTGWTGTSPRAA